LKPNQTNGRKRAGWLSFAAAQVSAIELRFPLLSRGFLSIFDQGIFSGASFLTAVLIGRATSPRELGLYYLVLSIILVATGVQEQIVSAPYLVYSKRRKGRELAEYAGSMWVHHVIITAVTLIVALVAILVLTLAGKIEIVPGLWAFFFAAPLLMFRQCVRRFTFASLEFKMAVALDALIAFVQLAGLTLLVYNGWLSLFRIFAVMGIACGVGCLGWYFLERPRLRFVRARLVSDWRNNWRFSKWALRTYILGNTTPQLMLWLLTAAVGPAATGLFGACNNLIGISNVFLGGVDNALTPQAAHAYATGGVKELRRVLMIVGLFLAITMGGCFLFVLFTGDWLMVLIFGDSYRGTGAILIVLTASTLMHCLGTLAHNGLWAVDRPRSNFVADVCCLTVTLIVAAFLILPYGALGAAFATLAGITAAALVRSLTLLRYFEAQLLEANVATNSALPT
jgi:O-antigen/teichoic acid export membrane protein